MSNTRRLAQGSFGQIAFVILLGASLCGIGSAKKKQPAAHALIAGTVFHKSGHSLYGAKVIVFNEAQPKKKLRGVSDRRGEFVVRVPAGKAHYVVRVSAKGFDSAEKKVQIYGMEKVNVNFMLSPEERGKKSK